jgi:hypothetical protein
MAKFDYNDVVRVVSHGDEKFRPGATAWVVAVFEKKPPGQHFASFPDGAVYMIEFEDGEAIDIPEAMLEPARVSLSEGGESKSPGRG